MDFADFINWAFMGILSGGLVFLIAILNEVKVSIQNLNERMAVLIEKTVWHEKALEKHEERIAKLENH